MTQFNYNRIKERLLNRLKSKENNNNNNNKLLEPVVDVYPEGMNSTTNYVESITLKSNILKRPLVTEEEIKKYFGD